MHHRTTAAGAFQNLNDNLDSYLEVVEQSERENFIKNMGDHQAAYLQVDIAPWREAADRIRRKLLDEGELDAETWTVVEHCRPQSKQNLEREPS